MNLKRFVILLIFTMLSVLANAQITAEKARLKKQRLKSIERYHANIGLESGFNNNITYGPRISVGYGSAINLLNFDMGAKYILVNSIFLENAKHLTLNQTAFFMSVQCNVVKWDFKYAYLGMEMDYFLPVFNKQISHEHFSGRIHLGVSIRKYNVSVFYEYDLAPMMNQKYVYESEDYDYQTLHDSLFERWRFGISVTYNIVFDL